MSLFGGFFGRLFGTQKSIDGIVDSVKNGLDALVYTDEEKANDAAKDRTEARQMIVQWMASTQGQNLARRLIALTITAVWLLQYLAAQVASIVAVFLADPVQLQQASVLMREGANEMGSAVMLILAFYFAAPHMGDLMKAVTGRFTQSLNKG